MSVKIIVTVCLIVAVVFFAWYFVTSREKFASDEIHYYSSLHNQKQQEEQQKQQEEQQKQQEEQQKQQEEQQENKRTPLNFEDFTNNKPPPRTEIDSILKGPEEQKSFIPSEHFTGQKDGYVFKKGRHGNGYYLDRHVQFNL
jgi:uncharacterized protein YxeA